MCRIARHFRVGHGARQLTDNSAANDKTVVTVTLQVAEGVVHMVDYSDGGGWYIGHVDVWDMFSHFEGRRVRVRVEVLDGGTE